MKFSLSAERKNDETVILHGVVEDTGIGIRRENQDQLFEPFSQVDLLQNRQAEGTGLGLTITKQLLGLMGGEISLQSVYGEGSKFFFSIPQKVNDRTPIAAINEPHDKRVLIAADELKATACVNMLKRLGVEADVAHSMDRFSGQITEHTYTHIIYYYDVFHAAIAQNDTLLGDCRLVAIKDIRYAGKQQTRQTVSVLFEPILIHELARVIDYAENSQGYDFYSDASEIGRFTVKDTRTLIVDDNEVNLMVMNQLLGQYNMEGTLASNGMEALDISKNQKFDIIFMDHMMPIMNGVEATKKIRAEDNPNKDTPIIIVTANAIVGMKEEFLSEGLDDYISKPIEIKELNAVLKKWIPNNKIVEASDLDEEDSESASALFLQGMAGIGLNAMEVCDSMGYNIETYMAIIDTFTGSVPDTLEKLIRYRDEKDYDSFRIDVHGIKSALANIGAKKLSKAAARLESAASQQNGDYISGSFLEFYDELSDLVGNIRELKPLMQPQTRHEIAPSDEAADDATIREYLDRVLEALDSLDSIQALDSLVELSTHLSADQLGEIATTLDDIRINIENFDYEAAMVQINDMMHVYSA